MISQLQKFSAVAICTTAISLVGIKANLVQALTFGLDIEVGNNSFSGFLDIVDNAFDDDMLNDQELEQLVINNFTLEGNSVSLPSPLIFNDFTGSNFNISALDLFNDQLNNIDGKLVSTSTDGNSSFSLLVGDNTNDSNNELEFEFLSPILAGMGGSFSLSFTEEQVEQTDVLSLALIPVSTPEPAATFGLLTVGAAGAVSTLMRRQK
ncbi:PEP-CTERM sorting domain-containing protein [Okeania sp.]|uniref:PEP-CTERM sorting domain-containing protein n=1 Tax=Okeania sp. TaxID=3100323 RepID=UPI002B4B8ED5|nr:PEP-CTERM sorting domain-containing protein [Okeania sp.]MEB3340298.1 PEP-CTERM sorting domain-containing protein [Okeania sp.]